MKRLALSFIIFAAGIGLLWRPSPASAANAQCIKVNSRHVWATATCPGGVSAGNYYLLDSSNNASVVSQSDFQNVSGSDQTKIPYGCVGGPAGPPSPGTVCPGHASTLSGKATDTHCSNGSGKDIFVATPGLNLDCSGGKNPIYALVQFIINWAIRLLGALAVLAIVISGIQYIVSQGSPDGLKTAKSRLSHAVIGLILLSLMFVILRLIGIAS